MGGSVLHHICKVVSGGNGIVISAGAAENAGTLTGISDEPETRDRAL